MQIVIVDKVSLDSQNIKESLLRDIDDIERVVIIDNETEALNIVRQDYELFIINTALDGLDGEFVNYCNKKNKNVIIYTDDNNEDTIDEFNTLQIIDYIIKSKCVTPDIIVDTVKRYMRNFDLKILFYSNDTKSKLEIINHIESQNIDILEARNFEDIMRTIEYDDIEMLLIDYEMLDAKGLDLIRAVRTKKGMGELPIVMFSYFLRNYIIARFLRSGINDIIYKPYLKEELLNIINLTIDKKELLKESYEWLLMDSITGLYRYQAVESFGEKMLSSAKREKKPFSIVLVKVIFNFENNIRVKKNTVLKHFGSIVGSSLRRGDLISKYSSDKIILILQNTDKINAKIVIDKLQKHIESFPCLDEDNSIVPYSIQGAIEEKGDYTLNMMIDMADELLYRAVKFKE